MHDQGYKNVANDVNDSGCPKPCVFEAYPLGSKLFGYPAPFARRLGYPSPTNEFVADGLTVLCVSKVILIPMLGKCDRNNERDEKPDEPDDYSSDLRR